MKDNWGGGEVNNRTKERTEETQLRVTFCILRDPWLCLGLVISAGYITSLKFSCSSLLMRWHSNKWEDNLRCSTFIASEESAPWLSLQYRQLEGEGELPQIKPLAKRE